MRALVVSAACILTALACIPAPASADPPNVTCLEFDTGFWECGVYAGNGRTCVYYSENVIGGSGDGRCGVEVRGAVGGELEVCILKSGAEACELP